jgi:hypothetical protein
LALAETGGAAAGAAADHSDDCQIQSSLGRAHQPSPRRADTTLDASLIHSMLSLSVMSFARAVLPGSAPS